MNMEYRIREEYDGFYVEARVEIYRKKERETEDWVTLNDIGAIPSADSHFRPCKHTTLDSANTAVDIFKRDIEEQKRRESFVTKYHYLDLVQ